MSKTMIHHDIEEKFNSAIDLGVAALGGAIVSGILLLTPVKAVGYIGMGGSVSGFVASVITKKKLAKSATGIVIVKNEQIQKSIDDISKLNIEYRALEAKKEKVLELANQALKLQEELKILQESNDELIGEKSKLKEQLQEVIANSTVNLENIKQIVLEAIGERQRALYQALEGLTRRKEYPLPADCVNILKTDIDEIIKRYFSALQEAFCVEDSCNILHWATDELANVKVRMIKSHQSFRINALISQVTKLEEVNNEWQQAGLVPRSTLEKVKADCIARLKEFHLDAKSQLGEVWGYANELEKQLPEDEKFFERLKTELQNYERKLEEASKPHRFVGTTEQAKVGNALIDYYLRSGIVLDAIDWMGTEVGYKLMFHFGRNGVYISPDQLHENDARQQIKVMTSSLSLPEFKQSERGGHLYLEVQQRLPQKRDNVKESQRILLDLDKAIAKIIASLSDKPTIRIMGATGEGKGVMARYLLNRILESNNWYTRLHDPQDGSSEDYWGIPKVSRQGTELEKALIGIHDQMIDREANGWKIGTLDILDEIDTHLDKQAKKDNFIDLISRIRHLGMKLILIGQNPKVGRAGFEWTDMEQMTCIYMGASAYSAVLNNPQLKPKETKLTKEYTQLSEHFEELNEGLDGNERHLFGLVIIPGKTPFWIELPRPDSIEVSCNSKLLGKTFIIPNSLIDILESQNLDKTSGNFGKTNNNSVPSGKAQTFTNQGLTELSSTLDYVGVPDKGDKTDNSVKATCKKHPEGELRLYKDGRYYCPGCEKRIPKSQIEFK